MSYPPRRTSGRPFPVHRIPARPSRPRLRRPGRWTYVLIVFGALVRANGAGLVARTGPLVRRVISPSTSAWPSNGATAPSPAASASSSSASIATLWLPVLGGRCAAASRSQRCCSSRSSGADRPRAAGTPDRDLSVTETPSRSSSCCSRGGFSASPAASRPRRPPTGPSARRHDLGGAPRGPDRPVPGFVELRRLVCPDWPTCMNGEHFHLGRHPGCTSSTHWATAWSSPSSTAPGSSATTRVPSAGSRSRRFRPGAGLRRNRERAAPPRSR